MNKCTHINWIFGKTTKQIKKLKAKKYKFKKGRKTAQGGISVLVTSL